MGDLNMAQMENAIKGLRVKQFETAKEVLNITSAAIRIHESRNLKDKKKRDRYKSILKDAMDILELLDKCDAICEN